MSRIHRDRKMISWETENFCTADKAMELAGFKKGSRILDIGCGEGDVTAHLAAKYDMQAEGIDMNLSAVSAAGEKHPEINVKFGDGEFLDDYSSFSFDGVFMQRVLALINIPDEALHEAYCVLKKGGRLVIVDAYYKNPDPKQMKALEIEAQRLSKAPRKEGDCEENPVRFVDFRFDDIFFAEPLKRQLEEIGYRVSVFEDIDAEPDERISAKGRKNVGYFIMVAEKPL